MRYIRIPEAVQLRDPASNEPIDKRASFAEFIGATTAAMLNDLDALVLLDLRKTLSRKPGEWVELAEDHWQALRDKLKRPTFLNPAFVFSGETHLRAVLDAPTERPAVLSPNGESAVREA